MEVIRLAAFSDGSHGGNPAGVVLCEDLPEPAIMQEMAAKIGYSETVFGAPQSGAWRTRYFAPQMEIPFCGHATIALGAALAIRCGDGVFPLRLNSGAIMVEGHCSDASLAAALQSPPTRSERIEADDLALALNLFGLTRGDLDADLLPAFTEAGARHLVLALSSRFRLAHMEYDTEAGASLMRRWGLATINLIHAETPTLFHSRNAFAIGGVYEDPATGAAAAALAGYLREIAWPHNGKIQINQGDDMGIACRLHAEISAVSGAPIRVSGTVRRI